MESPSMQGQEEQKYKAPLCTRIMRKLDLFSFMPVPKADLVSSKRSMYGSMIMFALFFTYFIFTLVEFIINNTPKVNQYTDVLPLYNISMPSIAFGFFIGDPFSGTINNKSSISFKFQQVVKYQDVTKGDESFDIPLVNCFPPWLPNQHFPLLCPIANGNMSGALYQTPLFIYPRIQATYCQPSENNQCVTQQELFDITAGGRILLYILDEGPNFDLTTGLDIDKIPYQAFSFFMIPGLYPRASFYFQRQRFTIYPDYFRRYQTQVREFLTIESGTNWITNVSTYNPYDAYQIFFKMDLSQQESYLTYTTLFEMISLWGAFWGVLFASFAAYFLSYNSSEFYNSNSDWNNFGNKISVIKPKDAQDQEDQMKQFHANNTMVFEMAPV